MSQKPDNPIKNNNEQRTEENKNDQKHKIGNMLIKNK